MSKVEDGMAEEISNTVEPEPEKPEGSAESMEVNMTLVTHKPLSLDQVMKMMMKMLMMMMTMMIMIMIMLVIIMIMIMIMMMMTS